MFHYSKYTHLTWCLLIGIILVNVRYRSEIALAADSSLICGKLQPFYCRYMSPTFLRPAIIQSNHAIIATTSCRIQYSSECRLHKPHRLHFHGYRHLHCFSRSPHEWNSTCSSFPSFAIDSHVPTTWIAQEYNSHSHNSFCRCWRLPWLPHCEAKAEYHFRLASHIARKHTQLPTSTFCTHNRIQELWLSGKLIRFEWGEMHVGSNPASSSYSRRVQFFVGLDAPAVIFVAFRAMFTRSVHGQSSVPGCLFSSFW